MTTDRAAPPPGSEPPPDRRPWPAYLHGDVVVVPASVCAFLLLHADLARLRIRARGDDPVTDAVLIAVAVAGNQWRTRASATSADRGSALDGSTRNAEPQNMTTAEAAAQLSVTPRAIRLAIAGGRLPATRTPHGWRIRPADLDHPRPRRGA